MIIFPPSETSLRNEHDVDHEPDGQRPIVVADFAIVRVAMLAYDAVIDLVPPTFRAALAKAVGATEDVRATGEELSHALHAVVPTCPDQRTRRAVLGIRRQLYGGSVRDHDAALAVLQSVALPGDVAALAARWHDRAARAAAGDAEFAVEWTRARQVGADALRSMLEREEISAAVSVASPELIDMLARSDRAKRLRAELSLARYVTRAATKTSPFSSLTGVVPTAFGGDERVAPDLTGITWTNRARVNRALCAAVDYATSEMLAEQPHARVVRTASFRALDAARAEWCEPDYFAVLGRPWRAARVVCVRLHPAIVQVLLQLDGPVRVAEIDAELRRAGLAPQNCAVLLRMLLKRGALRNADAPDAYCAAADASMLERDIPGSLSRLSARFARLREHVAAVRTADVSRRERALAESRREADALVEAAGIGERLVLKNVLLETCTGTSVSAVLGAGTQRVCYDVARAVGRRMVVNPIYGVLREFFVANFGPDGSVDLESFVERAARACGDAKNFARLKAAIPRLPAPAIPAPFTVFGQLCSPAADARFVVNSIVAGTGQLSARYAAPDNDGSGALRHALTHWLKQCAGEADSTDVTLAGDCNDLQSHPRITDRILPWAGDFVQPQRGGVDRGSELMVTFDCAHHALRVHGSDGRARALSYLGAVYLNAAYGPEFFLQALGQPYIALLPDEAMPDEGAGAVVPFERIVEDAIVLRRARWLVRTDYLRSWFARGDVHDLIDIRLECRREGIPRQFFAKAVVADARHRLDAPLDARKPQWIDSENPLCLALLRRLFDISPWIEIVEMLPERHAMPLAADGLPHATELQFEITV